MFIKTFKGSITNWNKNVLFCYKREQIICTLKPSSSTGNKEVKPRSSLKSFFCYKSIQFLVFISARWKDEANDWKSGRIYH